MILKIIFSLSIFLALHLPLDSAEDYKAVLEIPTKKELTINEMIDQAAVEYDVDTWLLHYIIDCESDYDVDVQSKHRYTFTDAKRGIYEGEREKSYGLVQISLPHHPYVSYEEAIDPEFAIDFLAKNVTHNGTWWSCYPS